MKKIIFLVSGTGGGPRTSAQAIILTLKQMGCFKTEIIDFLNEGNYWFNKFIKKIYSKSIHNTRSSVGYGLVYHLTNNKMGREIIKPLYWLVCRRVNKLILDKKPDAIISLHGLAGYLGQKIIQNNQLQIPLIIVVADPVSVHASWIEPKADLIIVATEQAKKQCSAYRIPESKIKVLGLPIKPGFYEKPKNLENIRKKFAIKPGYLTLFTGGGEGGGTIYKIVCEVLSQKIATQILVVCGRNKKLQEKLSSLPVAVLGYTNKMPEIMSIANIVIGKAGPGTIEEAISNGLPIIITDYVHGQEKANIKYAQERTRAYFQKNPKKVAEIIKKEMKKNLPKLNPVQKKDAPVYKIARTIAETLK